jgi:hypothetical protein
MKPIHQPTQEVQYCTQTSWRSNLPTCLPIAIGITKLPTLASCIILLLFLINANAYAGNYTWNGATSTNWSTSSNWSPAGVPSTNDTVTLSNGGVNSILLDGNRTITRLIISANTINLNTYELHVSGRSSLNGGAINNGNLKIRGTYAYFQGTNFNCILDVIAGQIKFSGGTFDKTGSFEQNGSASGYGEGGCTFNDDVTIKNTGTVYLRMGQDDGDTFNGKVYLYSSGNYSLQMAYGDTSYFNDTIFVNSTGNGGISFANGTYGASILGDSACLVTGSTGISAGTIQFKNIVQSATSSNSITASGSVLFNVYSNNFLGKVNFTAPNLVVKSTTFSDSTSLTKTGHTLNNTWDGGNVYNGVVTITNGNTSTAYVKLASQNADTYNDDVYFNAGTGAIQAANAGTNIYNGNVSVNGNNVTFNTSGGTLKFAGEQNQEFGGGSNTLTFNKLIVDKAGGSVTLNQPITIDSLLQLTSGIIFTDTIITLKATATTTGASIQSFVDGTVKKIGNTAFAFPVGDDGHYYPLTITAPSISTDAYSCQYIYGYHNESDSADTTLSYISQCAYWELDRITGSSNIRVTLSWDSLGCGIFDTAGVTIANWDGMRWRNLGNAGISGDPYIGNMMSTLDVISYRKFVWASDIPVSYITVTLGTPRSMPEDFFGYNGNNTIASDIDGVPLQSWAKLAIDNVLVDNSISMMRLPAGTLSNYFDWRTGYPLIERDLPYDWFYDKSSYRLPMNRTGNEYANVRDNLQMMAARPIIAFNMLTSIYEFELASIYRLQEVNLPIRYIELGNEFYLNDEHYIEKFPSVTNYVDMAKQWASDFRALGLPQTGDEKIAIIGAKSNENSTGRRILWIDQVLGGLGNNDNIEAITIHDYIFEGAAQGACTGSVSNANLQKFLSLPFSNGDLLMEDEFMKVQNFNAANPGEELEIWITEYNLDDDNDKRTGTWAHGLLNAAMTLKYLETTEVTKAISHTMLTDAKFGNIFESDNAFEDVACHGSPANAVITTVAKEFSSIGTSLDMIARATRNSVNAYPLVFSSTSTLSGTTYKDVYGWSFEDADGNQKMIVLNLSTQTNELNFSSIPGSISSTTFTGRVVSANDLAYAIVGDPVTSTLSNDRLFEDNMPWNVSNIDNIDMPPFSMLLLEQNDISNPYYNARLTDDEICSGTSTTLVIESNDLVNINLSCSTCAGEVTWSLTSMNGNRGLITLTAEQSISSTTTHTIQLCSTCTASPVTLTVHENLSDLLITSSEPINGNVIEHCYGATPIELTATCSTGNGGSISNHSYLWAPAIDSGLISSDCIGNTPMCSTITVDPKFSTTYTVYVNDGHCWQSRSVTVKIPVSPFDLGDDITVCEGTEVKITANYVDEDESTEFDYLGTDDPDDPVYTITNAVLGTNIYTITVTDGISNSCSLSVDISVTAIECCLPTASVVLTPRKVGRSYYSQAADLVSLIEEACPNCITTITSDDGTDILVVDIDGTNLGGPISIDGEFLVRAGNSPTLDTYDLFLHDCTINLGENALINIGTGRQLTLENCTLTSCGANMWQGIVLDKKGDRNPPEIILIDCYIENAQTAIYLTREAIYKMENCTFNNNFIDVQFENYLRGISNGMQSSTKYSISGCLFTSDGNFLLPPHDADYKHTAFDLKDVERIRIGVPGNDPNIIEESTFGIKLENSGAEIWNNEFDGISDFGLSSNNNFGTGIFLENEPHFLGRSLVVGENTGNPSNIFTNCRNGIWGTGECNYLIEKNQFGNDNGSVTTGAISGSCIRIEEVIENEISIVNENKFYDFIKGITLYDIGENVTLSITGNEFYDAIWSTPTMSYNATAISIMNPLPNFFSTQALIEDNDIGFSTDTDHHSRIGVSIFQAGNVRTTGNRLNFHYDRDLYSSFCGIQLVNSQDCRVYDNEIINTNFDSDAEHLVTGVRISESITPRVNCNTIQSMGYGIHFTGDNGAVTLARNNFTSYKRGISLGWDNSTPAFIGQIQGSPDPSPDGTGFKNQWDASSDDRVEGFSNQFISWYHDGPINYTTNNFAPVNSSGLTMQGLFAIANAEETDNCATVNTWLWNRISGYSGLVFDSIRFDGTYASQLLYEHKQSCFKYFDLDSSLLEGDGNDTMYRYVFNQLKSSNIGKVQNVIKKTKAGEYLLSNDLNEVIEDTNHFETLAKDVMSIYLNSKINSTVFSAEDTTALTEIAYQNHLTGGEAVFLARAMLRLEIEDGPLGEARMMNPKVKKTSRNFTIQPNPAFDLVFLKYSDEENLQHIIITDNTGREIIKRDRTSYLSISGLNPGIYFVILQYNDGEKLMQKLIKLE